MVTQSHEDVVLVDALLSVADHDIVSVGDSVFVLVEGLEKG